MMFTHVCTQGLSIYTFRLNYKGKETGNLDYSAFQNKFINTSSGIHVLCTKILYSGYNSNFSNGGSSGFSIKQARRHWNKEQERSDRNQRKDVDMSCDILEGACTKVIEYWSSLLFVFDYKCISIHMYCIKTFNEVCFCVIHRNRITNCNHLCHREQILKNSIIRHPSPYVCMRGSRKFSGWGREINVFVGDRGSEPIYGKFGWRYFSV